MRFVTCTVCGNGQTPLNTSLIVDEIVYCDKCLKDKYPIPDEMNGRKVIHQFDPTICSNCSKDFGEYPLRLHGSYPMCDECQLSIEKRILPTWVKAFFAGILLLVVFSLVWNWRFIDAYYELKKADDVLANGDLQQVTAYYTNLSEKLPENSELSALSSYYKGIQMLNDDKGSEALQSFKNAESLPEEFNVPIYALQAEASKSFDNKDYRGFVGAISRLILYDTSAVTRAQLASGYACLYAVEKSDSTKELALYYLHDATSRGDTTRFLAEYVNRIEHRLATGVIIDSKTFKAQYPNGWTK
jgi:hypothetical protein